MLSRRSFITNSATVALVGSAALRAPNVFAGSARAERLGLWLRNRQTGEDASEVYLQNGSVLLDGYYRICTILRDVRDEKIVQMPLGLLNLLGRIQSVYYHLGGGLAPLQVHSGFRTKAHNESIEGAARNSYHLYGWAADISIQGLAAEHLARIASYCGAGGIGIYDTFVHVDTGDSRIWLGNSRPKSAPQPIATR